MTGKAPKAPKAPKVKEVVEVKSVAAAVVPPAFVDASSTPNLSGEVDGGYTTEEASEDE